MSKGVSVRRLCKKTRDVGYESASLEPQASAAGGIRSAQMHGARCTDTRSIFVVTTDSSI